MRSVRAGARVSVLFSTFFLFLLDAEAQNRQVDHNFHGWGMYFGDHPIGNSPWGVHLEGQWRRHDGFNQWQQLLLRPAVNYTINPHVRLTAGYGFIDTYVYGDFPMVRSRTPEHRLFEQVQFMYKTGKVAWSTRVRFENRWLGRLDPVTDEVAGFRYENRLRLSQRAAVPLSPNYYIAAYNEIKFYVKPYVSASALDQNRAYVALGRKFGPDWDFEAGYLHQPVWQRNGRVLESNHTMMFTITSRQKFGRR